MNRPNCLMSVVLIVFMGAFALPTLAQTVAITNAEIHTVSSGVIHGGTIVVRDGRITAVGSNVSVPSGARTIDGTGKVVTPGFMDSSSGLGLRELGRASQDAATSEEDIGASFNPVWAVNPANTFIPVARIRGLTSVVVVPGGDQLFTGQGAVIALYGETLDAMLRSESVAVYTAMGESGSSRAGGSRAANYRRLHDALWDARARTLEHDENDDNEDPFAEGGRSSLTDRELEVVEAVISGQIPIVVTVNRASDLRLALKLKEEFEISLVILGGAEAWRVADELAAANVPVILNVPSNLPTFDGLGASLENAGILERAGVEVLLTGDRGISHSAGLAVANGMTHAGALRAVTLAPATVWGLENEMGSLENGKVADLVVWSGDPFELSTSVEHVFISGQELPDDSRQERLFERYRNLGRYRTIQR